jgi:hypothetical protein
LNVLFSSHLSSIAQVYSYPGAASASEVAGCNTKRLADVWMDEYSHLFESTRSKRMREAGQ